MNCAMTSHRLKRSCTDDSDRYSFSNDLFPRWNLANEKSAWINLEIKYKTTEKLMKKILTVFGTRPEVIKLAPVMTELNNSNSDIQSLSCATGQHQTMAEMMLQLFDLTPDFRLNIMRDEQTLFELTSTALTRLNSLLLEIQPDLVVVQGDTTTSFTAALAAFYLKIPVGHVEAGLRSHRRYEPFPEETNRRLISHIATLHFAPTEGARQNLLKEGISHGSVFVTGNTVIDALQKVQEQVHEREFPELEQIDFGKKIILATVHRRENFGLPLRRIFAAFKEILSQYRDVAIVYPMHLNPHVRKIVLEELRDLDRVHLLEPVNYLTFVALMDRSYMIVSDSGGIQEEAPSLHKPLLILREVSERPEVVEVGAASLVGDNTEAIVRSVSLLLEDQEVYRRMALAENPFGDGNAGCRIGEQIRDYLCDGRK